MRRTGTRLPRVHRVREAAWQGISVGRRRVTSSPAIGPRRSGRRPEPNPNFQPATKLNEILYPSSFSPPVMAPDAVAADDVDEDQLFDALANGRRRQILAVLGDGESSLPLSDLARALARREAGVATDGDGGGRADHVSVRREHEELADQLKITLHHRHLPRLAEAGLVNYDDEAKRVELGDLPAEIEPVLERTTT